MIDEKIAQDLKDDFSPKKTIWELFTACTALADAIGIVVAWETVGVTTVNPDKKAIAKGMTHLVTAMAALQAGANINPFQMIRERENVERESIGSNKK